jgi:thiol-disulfide isomerase/thioredoxin
MPTASTLAKMIPLQSHKQFEDLYTPDPGSKPLSHPVLIAFFASWCGPCQRIDWEFILEEFPSLPIYACDIDVNKYTPGFCGIKSIPSVLLLTPGENRSNVIGPLQTSDTSKICSWILMNLKSK